MQRKLSIVLIGAAACMALRGQGGGAQISGVVRDTTGLPVPAAEVQATNTETDQTRTVQTGEDGSYTFAALPIGAYKIQVTKQGFSTYVQSGILLQVGSAATVEVGLRVGAISEQVQVTADSAMVETHSTGIGQVVDQHRVVELPLNGRQAQYLIFLAGAAVTAPPGNLNSTKNYPTVVISVAGSLASGLTYMLDGATHNDPFSNQALPIPFPDALQEFKLETSALPAQYGHHSAAAVNAVTKSGTNEYHGNAFEFLRNGDLNARDFFAPTRDTLKRNQFGGTFGGPIKKDRIFFFVGYQQTMQRSDPSNGTAFIPTPAMLKGDFTAFAAPACNGGRPLTLAASAGFVNNKISPTLLSPAALKIMSFYPAPLDDCGKTLYGSVANTNEYLGLGRVDFRLNAKHSLATRYYGAHYFQNSPYPTGGNPLALQNAGIDPTNSMYSISETYLVSPTIVNTAHGTVNRAALFKFQNPAFAPKDVGIDAYSYQKFMVLTAGSFITGSVFAHAGYYDSLTFQAADDLSMVKGSHQFGFGFNWIKAQNNNDINLNAAGQYTFSGQFSGSALPDFLTGSLSAMTQGNPALLYSRSNYVSLYAQDSWKITSRIIFNYGVRWEPFLPVTLKNGRVSRFDQTAFDNNAHSVVYPNGPAGTFFPGDSNYDGNGVTGKRWATFAPRAGLVWDPKGDGKTSIRASYGRFYSSVHLFYDAQFAYANPIGDLIAADLTGGVKLDNPWKNYPGGNPFPLTLGKNSVFPPNGNYITYGPNTNPTYVQQWNFSLQRQLSQNWLFTVNYLGNNTIHGWAWKQINPGIYSATATTGNISTRRVLYLKNPAQGQFYGTVGQVDDGATATYDGLLISVQRRFANNFTILGNWTWSHCIADPIPNDSSTAGYTDPTNRRYDRGNCGGIDRRHVVNISAVYQTPKFSNAILGRLASNWQLSTIVAMQAGSYYTITSGVDRSFSGIAGQRPQHVLADPYAANQTVDQQFNPAAFATVPAGQLGNLGVNNILGPGTLQVDMSLSRTFSFAERFKTQFRLEAFNVPNRLNAAPPTLTLNSPNFGRILSDISTSAGAQASGPGQGNPRVLQVALKLSF
jgi:hypothetical protein